MRRRVSLTYVAHLACEKSLRDAAAEHVLALFFADAAPNPVAFTVLQRGDQARFLDWAGVANFLRAPCIFFGNGEENLGLNAAAESLLLPVPLHHFCSPGRCLRCACKSLSLCKPELHTIRSEVSAITRTIATGLTLNMQFLTQGLTWGSAVGGTPDLG